MSFQWTLLASYLYCEIVLVIIMMLPIISPKRWHQFFRSRIFGMFKEHAAVYFYVFLSVLCLLLIDAVREMRKCSSSSTVTHVDLHAEMKGHIKLFRAQRNFYITGFSIFLTFVIRRIISMLIVQDQLSEKAEMVIREAENTVKYAKATLLKNALSAKEQSDYETLKMQLESTEDLLIKEKTAVKDLEDEVKLWKSKYEEVNATGSIGKGDE